MANKIVLFDKGALEGIEYPLDADTGTNGRGIWWAGGDLFWVTIGTKIALYELDHKNDAAKFTGESFTASMVSVTGLTSNGHLLFVYGNIVGNITRKTYGYRPYHFDGSGPVEDDILVAGFGSVLPAGFGVRDCSCNDERLFHQINGGGGASPTYELQDAQFLQNTTGAAAIGLDSGDASAFGLTMDRKGGGFWWSDNAKNIRYVPIYEDKFPAEVNYTITHSGTMRGMDDCGSKLAMMFN